MENEFQVVIKESKFVVIVRTFVVAMETFEESSRHFVKFLFFL